MRCFFSYVTSSTPGRKRECVCLRVFSPSGYVYISPRGNFEVRHRARVENRRRRRGKERESLRPCFGIRSIEKERERSLIFSTRIYTSSLLSKRDAFSRALRRAIRDAIQTRSQRRHHKEKRRRRRNKFERRTRGIFTNECAHTQQHAFFLLHAPKRTPEDAPMKALKVAL